MLQQTAVQHWTGLLSFWPGIVERRVSESKERADIQSLQHRIPKVMLLVSQYRLIYELKTTVTFKLTKLARPPLSEAELPAPRRQMACCEARLVSLRNSDRRVPPPAPESPVPKITRVLVWPLLRVLSSCPPSPARGPEDQDGSAQLCRFT